MSRRIFGIFDIAFNPTPPHPSPKSVVFVDRRFVYIRRRNPTDLRIYVYLFSFVVINLTVSDVTGIRPTKCNFGFTSAALRVVKQKTRTRPEEPMLKRVTFSDPALDGLVAIFSRGIPSAVTRSLRSFTNQRARRRKYAFKRARACVTSI